MVEEYMPRTTMKKITINFMKDEYKSIGCFCYFKDQSNYDHARKRLHIKEQNHLSCLKYEKRQKSYILGRYCAKRAISGYLDEEDAMYISIDQGVFNQPIIIGSNDENLQVSISHCGNFGGAIVYEERFLMGLDIERIDERNRSTLENEMTTEEKVIVASLPFETNYGLTLYWTAKEALSKALKTGLMTPFSIYEINKIQIEEGYASCYFKFFAQYKTRSFHIGQYMCSIVYPKNIEIDIDVENISMLLNV
ncbi:MAG: 4'-phosphopantetheinyl transferase [Firmicutes bacterium HGW-Firmicutes-7]|nr:MAG: 4'-phosphopantetheinyl transferase [Firmicutes bacterium HGW-Firmicutes-7]